MLRIRIAFICILLTTCLQIALDDLRKPNVVRDMQQYILNRLDADAGLRKHLSRENADMLNQLHIKSNGKQCM